MGGRERRRATRRRNPDHARPEAARRSSVPHVRTAVLLEAARPGPARSAPPSWCSPSALAVTAACGGDDDDDVASGPVQVEDAGAESGRVQLPGAAEVGRTGSASATVDISLTVEGSGVHQEVPVTLRLDDDAEVVEAGTSGYVVENEFTGAEVIDAPAGADFSSVEDLVGVRYRETFNPDGTSDDTELVDEGHLTDAQREAYEQFGSQVESTAFDDPDEPIGVGATWTSVSTVQQ